MLHCFDTTPMRQRPHLCSWIQPITNAQIRYCTGKFINKTLINRLLNVKTTRRNTYLTSISHFQTHQQCNCSVNICIVEYDNRWMTSQLHGDPFHVCTGQRRQVFTHRNRPSERNLPNDWRSKQMLWHFRWVTPHNIETTWRQASIFKYLRKRNNRTRRIFRPF